MSLDPVYFSDLDSSVNVLAFGPSVGRISCEDSTLRLGTTSVTVSPAYQNSLWEFALGLKNGDNKLNIDVSADKKVSASVATTVNKHNFSFQSNGWKFSHSGVLCDTFAVSSTIEPVNGFLTECTAAANVTESFAAGMLVSYDPFRSGLKDWQFALKGKDLKPWKWMTSTATLTYAAKGTSASAAIPLGQPFGSNAGTWKLISHIGRESFTAGFNFSDIAKTSGNIYVDVFEKKLCLNASQRVFEKVTLNVSAKASATELIPKFGFFFCRSD